MNQILSVEMPGRQKTRKKANIKSILIFFCIVLLIFGIAMIAMGVISKFNFGGANTNTKPIIKVSQNEEILNITVTSDNLLQHVVYKWNNGEETQVNGNNENIMHLKVNMLEGRNILSIVATDEKGNSETFEEEYIGVAAYTPTIALEQEINKIKVLVESESIIDTITYKMDAAEQIEAVGNTNAAILIDAQEGMHNLAITVTDNQGRKYESNKPIYIPTVTVTTDGTYFIIKAEDLGENEKTNEVGLSKIAINFNGEESEKKIEGTNYDTKLELKSGENRLIVVLTNVNGLSYTRWVKFVKQ